MPNPEAASQPMLQYLHCQECQNTGRQRARRCQGCRGLGMVAWTGSTLLYWGRRIDRIQLTQEKLQNIVRLGINAALLLIGISGVGFLGWEVFQLSLRGVIAWDVWRYRSLPMFGFWLSLMADSYLIYRFQRDIEKIVHIPKRPYEELPAVINPIAWQQAHELPRHKRVDISEYYTVEAGQAVVQAWVLATKYRHHLVNPIHLFIGMLRFPAISLVFSRLGIPFEALKQRISAVLEREPIRNKNRVTFSPRVKETLFRAYFMAWELRQQKVSLAELLEAQVMQENEVLEVMRDLGADLDEVRNVVAWIRIRKLLRQNWQKFRQRAGLRPTNNLDRAMTAIATPFLNNFSQDLTRLAQTGYLAPCIGRQREISEIFEILNGGSRQSVLLIGNTGVGKSTIIEGIAQQMVAEEVPAFMQDKRLVGLDVAKLISGTGSTEAQQRLLVMLNEIQRAGNVVLVIENIHTMVGISAGRDGSLDLGGVLAQALQAGATHVIATATPSDYRRFIEQRSELDSVLEPLQVNEVTGNDAIQILEAKVGTIEYQHKVFFSYAAIAKTVELADRYIPDRMLPEKAIEILQEVATRVTKSRGDQATITDQDVAELISSKTNIPLGDITQEESDKLLNLEAKIHQRVVNQEEAVTMVAASLRRARAEMRSAQRPIVNLLFLGPTGVGKTELAKTVAEVYFGSEKQMIRLDMSEYQEKSSLNRLLGAPPGYQGANEGGHVTQAIRKNPFSLVLLDELEKAHPDILNVFLQVMDDGRLTDSQGRTVDFTNVILIATSNAATQEVQSLAKAGKTAEEIKTYLLDQKLYEYFRPEFVNRFDGVVIFKPLSMTHVEQISGLMLKKIGAQLEARGINFQVTPAAVRELAQKGYSEQFGARALRRIIQSEVQDALAKQLLSKSVSRRDTVIVDAGGQVRVEKAKPL